MKTGGGGPRPSPARGLWSSLARVARTFVDTLHTRAELLALELERERTRIVRIALFAVAALVLFALAAFTATIFVIAAFWDGPRLLAIGLLTLGYLGAACIVAAMVRREIARATRPFEVSLAQLKKDRDELMSHWP